MIILELPFTGLQFSVVAGFLATADYRCSTEEKNVFIDLYISNR